MLKSNAKKHSVLSAVTALFLVVSLLFSAAPFSMITARAASELGLSFSSSESTIAPGQEVEITIILNNYDDLGIESIMGLQVDVLLDTALVEYVPSSAATLATGNVGDIIGTNYNAGNNKVIFQYASMNENELPFARTNANLFKFKVKAKEEISSIQTAIFTATQFAVSDDNGNRIIPVSNTLSVTIEPPVSGDDLALNWSATSLSIAPGEETEITVVLQNYQNAEDIMGLQVDVLLDTTLVEYVPSSAATLATGNVGDIIGTNYNSGNKKVIFQYASMNENELPFNRSNTSLFKFKVKAKGEITENQTVVFTVTQLAVSDDNGNRKITVDNTLSVNIVADQEAPTITSVQMKTLPSKTEYIEGQSLDLTGAVLQVNYSDSTARDVNITADMVSGYSSTVGTKIITVTYQSKTTNFTVTVAAKSVAAISMKTTPTKTIYTVGESLDVTGGKITVNYNNSTSEDISIIPLMISGFSSLTTGVKTVTVTYGGKTTSFLATVNAAPPIDDAGYISVSSAKGTVGSTVSVPIILTDNPGVYSLSVSISYDATRLKLTGITNGTILEGAQHNTGNLAQNPYKLTFCNPIAPGDNTNNGVIATMQFEILSDAVLGDAYITATLDQENTFNFNMIDVPFIPENGRIEVVSKHTVTFKDWNGGILKEQEVISGDAATAPTNPSREGYDFIGWDLPFNNVTTNLVVTAQYQIKTYTITFKGYNNVTLSEQTIEHGSSAAAPEAPDVDGYVFLGWNKQFTNITESKIVTANYVLYADAPKIVVSSGGAYVGKTVDVTVNLENNLGIISLFAEIAYDRTKLELQSVTNGTVLSGASHNTGNLSPNPYTICFVNALATQNNTVNGTVVTLTFKVLETATEGDTPITITYQKENTLNVEGDEVFFLPINGVLSISSRLPGDVNDDGKVNMQDYIRLVRYLTGGWPDATEINMANSDVNGDGKVNMQDYIRLVRFLAGGWPDATELI